MADSEIIELIIKNNGLGTVENYQKINKILKYITIYVA